MADETKQEPGREKTFVEKARETLMGQVIRGPASAGDIAGLSEDHPAFSVGMEREWAENLRPY